MKKNKLLGIAAGIAAALAITPSAHAHQTYNLTGDNVGLAASVNNADGVSNTGGYAPVGVGGRVNGDANANIPGTGGLPADYVGALPYMWYSGQHTTATGTTTRHQYTGTSATDNPSLWRAYANQDASATWGALVPDIGTDHPYLAVGGDSWATGSGLDYGLIHVSCGANDASANCTSDGAIALDINVKLDSNYSDINGSGLLDVALYRGADSGAGADRTAAFDPDASGIQGSTLNSGGDLTKLWEASMTNLNEILSFHLVINEAEWAKTDAANGVLNDGDAGFYTLIIGAHNGGLGVAYDVTTITSAAPVPVPGAVWLFGSALAGFMGFGRRKANVVA